MTPGKFLNTGGCRFAPPDPGKSPGWADGLPAAPQFPGSFMKLRSFPVVLLLAASATAPAANWPQFRGLNGQGISPEREVPLHWTATSNVVWKTPIPGEAWSSPLVWDNHVFVTTATDGGETCHVLALDRHAGRVLWDRAVFKQTPRRKEQRNSYASPTPATDGERVYACFGDGSFVTLNFAGEVLWTNRNYPFYSQHGLGTSLRLHRGCVDHGPRRQQRRRGQSPWLAEALGPGLRAGLGRRHRPRALEGAARALAQLARHAGHWDRAGRTGTSGE